MPKQVMIAARKVNESAYDGKSVDRLELVAVTVEWPDGVDVSSESSNPYLQKGAWRLAVLKVDE